MKNAFIILLLISIIQITICYRGCDHPYFCCRKVDVTGYCTNQGYIPGGGKVILEPIEAPQATIQNNAIGVYGSYLGYALDIGGAEIDLAKITGEFAEHAKKLAAALGTWGQLVGAVAAWNTPTPQDIIDACNEALETLTNEINDQFLNMQAYVDQAIMEEDAKLMNLDYKQYHDYFTGCIDETIEDDMYDCMKEAERLSGSDHARFLRYESEMDQSGWKATTEDVKRMEVLFNTFRDYAELRILILLTLSGSYENKTSEEAPAAAKRYLTDLKNDVNLYIRYANFVYKTIYDMHALPKTWVNHQFLYHHLSCGDLREIKEGWPGAHTWDRLYCETLFSPMLIDTQKCGHDGYIRYQDNCPCKGSSDPNLQYCLDWTTIGGSQSYDTLRHYNAETILQPLFDKYTDEMIKSCENYWQANVMLNLPNWQAIYDGAVEKLKNYEDVKALEQDQVLSVKSQAKLYKAFLKRKQVEIIWDRNLAETFNITKGNSKMAGKRPTRDEL